MTWAEYMDTKTAAETAKGAAAEILQAYALGYNTMDNTIDDFHACIALADTDEEAQAFRDGLAAMDTI